MATSSASADYQEALFRSANDALRFAYNYSPAQYERPAMSRMADGPRRTGKGLVGLDGAAQAGFIQQEVGLLGRPKSTILEARYTNHSVPCRCHQPCCSGRIPNPEWQRVIGDLARWVLGAALSGCVSNYHLRRGLVERHFGIKHQFADLAAKCGVDRDTASHHNDKVTAALKYEETAAQFAITDRLKLIGIIEG